MRIIAKGRVYQTLGDAVLEIHVSNTSERRLSVRTTDADKPSAFYEDGQLAIISNPSPKDGTTRNIDYELRTKESRSYESTVSKLLGKDQRISGAGVGVMDVSVVFLIIRYEGATYKVDQIHSNLVKITIAPQ